MSNTESGRILVVDDDADVLTLVSDFLTELGYEVAGCRAAAEALNVLRKRDFDLLLADLVMPEIDGISLLKSIGKLAPHLTCIVITGQGTIESAVEAMKVGAFDYVTKPLDWKELRPVVSRAIEVTRLKRSEEKYRSIVEDQTEFICRWRPEGVITFVNDVICKYFGLPCDEIIGNTFARFLPPEDYKEFRKRVSMLNKENPVASVEHRVIMPDGEIRWQRWSNRAIFDEQGQIVEFQSVGHDITEFKVAEEELKRSHEQLRTLARRVSETEENERKRLARELHDQVGQNLTALGINLNMLRIQLSDRLGGDMNTRLDDSLNLLEETAKKIRDVMADLRPSLLDDYGLMAAIRWYGEHFSNRTGLEVSIDGHELKPRLPSVMEVTLFRVAQELLTNVAKHAVASRVSISLVEEGDRVSLTITDNGVGFDPVISDRGRAQNGWGFLNVRERVDSIGGKLTVESEAGRGTRVVIDIKR